VKVDPVRAKMLSQLTTRRKQSKVYLRSCTKDANLVERMLHHMCHSLSEGHNVKISGFGSFILRDKGQRVGRNPKTGIEVPIAPRRVMTFRASQIMRDKVAK